jgi:hypothetical protein
MFFVPWPASVTEWIYFLPLGLGALGVVAWVLFVLRIRSRIDGSGLRLLGGRNLNNGQHRGYLLGLAWQVAGTGQPTAETWPEAQAAAEQRVDREARRREIERDLDRRPY